MCHCLVFFRFGATLVARVWFSEECVAAEELLGDDLTSSLAHVPGACYAPLLIELAVHLALLPLLLELLTLSLVHVFLELQVKILVVIVSLSG